MTVMTHKILDALRGIGDVKMAYAAGARTYVPRFRAAIEASEKFDFGTLTKLEPADRPGDYIVPELTEVEREAWVLGLIPLPAPTCWYEFSLPGQKGWRSALLVEDAESGNAIITRVDIVDGASYFDGIHCCVIRDESDVTSCMFEIRGNKSAFKGIVADDHSINGFLAILLTLMLHSRTTVKGGEAAPTKLNKRRAERGLSPLAAHTIVDIAPKELTGTSRADGTHATPRLHWRRSHLRRFNNPTPNGKWHPGLGCYVTIIPRFLVGLGGDLTHEYKVVP